MKFLDNAKCEQWVSSHASSSWHHAETQNAGIAFTPPQIPHALFGFCDQLQKILGNSIGLLWVTDWPLYEKYEMSLFEIIRKGYGANNPLIETPGHLVEYAELHEISSLLALMSCFRWDASFIAENDAYLICTHHHEYMRVIVQNKMRAEDVNKLIENYHLPIGEK